MLVLVVGVTRAQGPEGMGVGPSGGGSLADSFTYQGRLSFGGLPATGYYDFRVTIWDSVSFGTQISSAQVFDNQYVDDGHFTFHIVPGDPMNEVFDGDERWIQVQVKLGAAPRGAHHGRHERPYAYHIQYAQ
jgi:hypothetical protein